MKSDRKEIEKDVKERQKGNKPSEREKERRVRQ